MSIVRTHKKKRNFSTLDNSAPNDETLSYRAKGVLWYLLTKPEDWTVRLSDIQAKSPKEGRDSIAAAFRELETAGYAIRRKVKNQKGQFTWETNIFETVEDAKNWTDSHNGFAVDGERETHNGFAVNGKSTYGQTVNGFSGHIVNTDQLNTDQLNIDQENTYKERASIFLADGSGGEEIQPKASALVVAPVNQNQQSIDIGWGQKMTPATRGAKSKWFDVYNREKPETWAIAFEHPNLEFGILNFERMTGDQALMTLRMALLEMKIEPGWYASEGTTFSGKSLGGLLKTPMQGEPLVLKLAGKALARGVTPEMLDVVSQKTTSEVQSAMKEYQRENNPITASIERSKQQKAESRQALETELERADRIDRERRGHWNTTQAGAA